jgi:cobalt-precorrin 5A hydrolase/precorrin-3B C17-methyltransferase
MDGAPVVVVGGGQVAERKIRGLLAVNAGIWVISPEATDQIQAWAEEKLIGWKKRTYRSGDLAGVALAFAATDHRAINMTVSRDASVQGILCNVVDAPEEGSFHVPAVHRGDGLLIAVSTGGEDPSLAVKVRDRIAAWLSTQLKNQEEPSNGNGHGG